MLRGSFRRFRFSVGEERLAKTVELVFQALINSVGDADVVIALIERQRVFGVEHLKTRRDLLAEVGRDDRTVGDVRDAGLAEVAVARELEVQDRRKVNLALVRSSQVAEVIGDHDVFFAAVVQRDRAPLDRTDHVRMRAEDHVHAVFEHQRRDLLLRVARLGDVFAAPVQTGDDNVRRGGLCGVEHLENVGGVDLGIVRGIVLVEQIDAVACVVRDRHAADALREADKGKADAVDLAHDDLIALAVGIAGKAAEGGHAGVLDDLLRARHALDAVIDRVGIRGLQDVEACVGQQGRKGIGIAGGRGGIRVAEEVALEIADGQIGGRQRGNDVCDRCGKIGRAVDGGGLELRVGEINVADGVHRRLGGGFLRGIGAAAGERPEQREQKTAGDQTAENSFEQKRTLLIVGGFYFTTFFPVVQEEIFIFDRD